jgi:hypothetical protein
VDAGRRATTTDGYIINGAVQSEQKLNNSFFEIAPPAKGEVPFEMVFWGD